MNWVDERNASAQSRYAQDITDWAQTLLDAARSQGYEASLTSMGSGDCGAPVLNVCNKVIPLGAMRYGEFQKYALDPAKWIGSQVNGTLYDLSPEARTLVQQEQLAALESAKASAQNEGGPAQVQAFIDQLKAFWETQSHSPQSECGAPVAQVPVSSGSGPAPPEKAAQQSAALPPGANGAEPLQPANSAYPFQPLPAGVLSPDPVMQAWYESILAAARRFDPNATLDNSIGIARVLVNGQQTILTSPMYDEFAQGYATPEQQVNRGVTGTPIALTPEQQMRLAQDQVRSLNNSFANLSPADAQRQFDAMRSSLNGVPGEVSLSIGSQRFPVALQDGNIVLSAAPESWDSISGNPPPAGLSSTPGPRLVTYADGMQGYVGPDGKTWRDASPTTSAWGTTPTPFD
jgi:hypothetical protein